MVEKFLAFIHSQRLFSKGEPILLAVSGGVDSMVMTHLFNICKLNFALGHINFQLRDQDSINDEAFVVQYAEKFSFPIHHVKVNTREHAVKNGISIQMAAREIRYSWLEKIRKEHGFHFIATAHHSDDSVETVLLNIFRGTGIAGLRGIQPKNDKIIRPMLPFTKKEIEAFAEQNSLPFRIDQSNLKSEYDRNKIRLEIIPAIEQFYPAVKQTLYGNIMNWQDANNLYQQQIALFRKRWVILKGDEVYIPINNFRNQISARTVLYELLKPFGFGKEQVQHIMASLDSISGKVFYSETHRLLKDRKHLIITGITKPFTSEELIMEQDTEVKTDSIELRIQIFKHSNFNIPLDETICCLDYEKLEFPLLLRRWTKGDYFYPIGMKLKKKKISDFLIDLKITMHKKEQTVVIVSGEKIACIAGLRIDDRFKVTPSTKMIWVLKSLEEVDYPTLSCCL